MPAPEIDREKLRAFVHKLRKGDHLLLLDRAIIVDCDRLLGLCVKHTAEGKHAEAAAAFEKEQRRGCVGRRGRIGRSTQPEEKGLPEGRFFWSPIWVGGVRCLTQNEPPVRGGVRYGVADGI